MTDATPNTPSPRRPRSRLAIAVFVVSLVGPVAWLVIVLFGAGSGHTIWESVRWLYAILGVDLLLGFVVLIRVPKGCRRLEGLDLAICAILISLFGLTIVAPAIRRSLDDARQAQCHSTIEQLSMALQMYAGDHGGRLPPADRWSDVLVPKYVRNPGVFKCPEARRLRCGYAFNRALSGMSVEKMEVLPQADKTVFLYESDLGWNGAGGPDSLAKRPRHRGKDEYVFADRSIRAIERTRASELVWQPSH